MAAPPPRRRAPPPTFRPRTTLGLAYLCAFFFLYCLLIAVPALVEVARSVPPGPEQQEAAARAAQEVVQPRLWIALAASLATTGLGIYSGRLPGLRRR